MSIKKAKRNAKKCGYFSYSKNNIFGVSPDGLVGLCLLTEIKTRRVGSVGPPEVSEKTLISFKHNCKCYVLVQNIAVSCHTILSLRVPTIF